jgi:hypothetical protein
VNNIGKADFEISKNAEIIPHKILPALKTFTVPGLLSPYVVISDFNCIFPTI